MTQEIKAVCFGEVLWDVFSNHERIGGAPLNVAYRLGSLGIKTEMISKIGADNKGVKIISYLKSKKIEIKNLKKDLNYPTGSVKVTLTPGGSASYDIIYPSAWDKIEISKNIIKSVREADIFIFGSLICRDKISRNSLLKLIPLAKYKVFDCNLRPPYYEKEILIKLMKNADFIKFNDDELFEIANLLGSPFNSLEQNLKFICDRFPAAIICITKGRHGAVLFKENKLFYNSGYKIEVKDTVGAGDSFLASLLAKLSQGEGAQKSLDYACAVGALVAGQKGANPVLDLLEIQNFMSGK